MFSGTSEISIDTKGRLSLPTKYRSEIMAKCNGKIICTIDIYDPCLLLYTQDEWVMIENKLRLLPNLDVNARRIQRTILGNAQECNMDQAGRILLPSILREHAKLDKNVLLVGLLNKFEIWDSTIGKKRALDDIATLSQSSIEDENSQYLRELSL